MVLACKVHELARIWASSLLVSSGLVRGRSPSLAYSLFAGAASFSIADKDDDDEDD